MIPHPPHLDDVHPLSGSGYVVIPHHLLPELLFVYLQLLDPALHAVGHLHELLVPKEIELGN